MYVVVPWYVCVMYCMFHAASGFLVKLEYLQQSRTGQPGLCAGLIYPHAAGPRGGLLLIQVIGILVIIGFSGTVSFALFTFLHKMSWLRVLSSDEMQGLDLLEGRPAYPDFMLVNGHDDCAGMGPAIPYAANVASAVEMGVRRGGDHQI
jgi:hypothetical protein